MAAQVAPAFVIIIMATYGKTREGGCRSCYLFVANDKHVFGKHAFGGNSQEAKQSTRYPAGWISFTLISWYIISLHRPT